MTVYKLRSTKINGKSLVDRIEGQLRKVLATSCALQFLTFWVGVCFVSADSSSIADRVLIVFNNTVPESKELADYYAQKRVVPTNQIFGVNIRNVETITRNEYEQHLHKPILNFMSKQRLLIQATATKRDPVLGRIPTIITIENKISCIVLMNGIPLRIQADTTLLGRTTTTNTPTVVERNEASVESELALLPTNGLPTAGALRNPFYQSDKTGFDPELNRQMVLVGRLDGPSPDIVRRMINDAIEAEYYGVHGRAYFDARGIKDAGYVEGDNWIRNSYQYFRDAGYESEYDDRPAILHEEDPVTDVAVYAGWYTLHVAGPFKRQSFRFQKGGIGYHIHSSSGVSVRTQTSLWVGPLLVKGAAVTMGNVFEPYLLLSPHVDIFLKRLLDGGTFIEAGYASQASLSWQTTFVGDPLYRPFAVSLDHQILRLEKGNHPDLEWAYVRKINLHVAAGEKAKAEQVCRRHAVRLSSDVLYEKLGDLLQNESRDEEAIVAYKHAIHDKADHYRKMRVVRKLGALYEKSGNLHEALAMYELLVTDYPKSKDAKEFLKKARTLAKATGNNLRENITEAHEDEQLD